MNSFVTVVGSVTPPGRLFRAAESSIAAAQACGADATQLFDLGTLDLPFADGRRPADIGGDTARIHDAIAAADAVLLASPVYRATFTGALKNLLDLLPIEALQAKPAGILAMGATDHHFLGVDWHLRAVLGWFGAIVPPTSVYLTSSDFEDGALRESAATEISQLVGALDTFASVPRDNLGPTPFAARR